MYTDKKLLSPAVYEARARIIKALAHPARLKIVDFLADEPQCVCEIQEAINGDQSTVSKHLSVLRNAGIVDFEKRGLQVFYRLRVPCILNFMGCVEEVIKAEYMSIKEVLV